MRRVALSRFVAMVVASALGVALPAVPAAGQRDRDKHDRRNVDGTLVIGSLAPETGDFSSIVESLRVPVQLAVQEINDAGGADGKPVTLVTGDDGSSADVASTTLTRMLETDKVDAIVGPASSPTTLGILTAIRTGRVLTCSGSNTAAELSTAKSDGYYFRTSPPDRLQGPALAELVRSDGHKKVGILARDDAYGLELDTSLKEALTAGRAKIVADVTYNPAGSSFGRAVRKIAAKKPDAVVVIGFDDDGAKVLQAMVAEGIGPANVPVYTVDGMQSARFAGLVDAADPAKVAGIKGTQPALAPAGVDSPFPAKLAATGTDPVFSAYYYDCTILIALAAEKAKSDDPTKMKKVFAQNLEGKRDCNTYADCKNLLDRGKTIHWRGASSNFDTFGKFEPKEGVYDVWSYDAAGKVQIEDSSSQIKIGGPSTHKAGGK